MSRIPSPEDLENKDLAKGKRHSEDQTVSVLKEIELGATTASVQTLYGWRERYAGVTKSELVETKSLQEENRRRRDSQRGRRRPSLIRLVRLILPQTR